MTTFSIGDRAHTTDASELYGHVVDDGGLSPMLLIRFPDGDYVAFHPNALEHLD